MRSSARARARLLTLLLSSTMTMACLTTERPAVMDSTRQVAGAVSLPASGEWQNGDERVTFTTTVHDSTIEVTEQVLFGTDGTSRRTLRIGPRGDLLQFSETRSQTAQATDRSPSRLQVSLELTFAGDTLHTRRKRVDGVDAPVRDYEVQAARTHAATLLDQFGGVRPTPPLRNSP